MAEEVKRVKMYYHIEEVKGKGVLPHKGGET